MGQHLAASVVCLIIGKQVPLITIKHPLKSIKDSCIVFLSVSIDCTSLLRQFLQEICFNQSFTRLRVVEEKHAIKPLLNSLINKTLFCLYSRGRVQPAKITSDRISRKQQNVKNKMAKPFDNPHLCEQLNRNRFTSSLKETSSHSDQLAKDVKTA